MNRFVSVLGGALAAAAGLSVAAAVFAHDGAHAEKSPTAAGEETVTIQGELIDTACYVAAEGDAKGKEHAGCAKKCLASGVPAGILPAGSKKAEDMMFLLTNPTVLARYAAQTVKVEGTAHPKMHAVDVKKLYVRQGNKWQEVQLDDEHHKMGEEGGHDHSDGHHEAGGDHAEGHGDADKGGAAAEPAAPAKRGAQR